MKAVMGMAVLLLVSLACGATVSAQQNPAMKQSQKPSMIASVLDTQLTIVEREFVGAAEAMPEDKYAFAPTNGEFEGVRTFAQQVKHVAMENNDFFNAILGQSAKGAPNEGAGSNGPDSIQTKEQILQYLRDSFALGHKAITTIDAGNAVTPLTNPAVPFLKTRAALAIFACTHAMDHYGQMVEYLRDNDMVPPASRPRPPANPPAR